MVAVHERNLRAGSVSGDDRPRSRVAVLVPLLALALALVRPSSAPAEPFSALRRDDPNRATTSRAARHDAQRSIPFGRLDADARAKVASVLQDVTFFRRMPIRVTQCDPELYLFLVRHPDVIVNIWQVTGVTKVTMQQTDPATFWINDPVGTQGSVEYLYSDHETQVIYTEGAYDGPLFAKPVRGRGLLILRSGYVREPDGRYYVTSRLDVLMRIDHLGIEILTKTFRPLVGKVADINFTYTADFLGNLSRSAERNGSGMQHLAGRLTRVQPQVRRQFARVARRVAEKATEISRHDFDRPPQVARRPADEGEP